jgi:hypothetical protein
MVFISTPIFELMIRPATYTFAAIILKNFPLMHNFEAPVKPHEPPVAGSGFRLSPE